MLTIFLYDKVKSNESFKFQVKASCLYLSSRLCSLVAEDALPLPEKYELLWEWHHCGKINELRALANLFFDNNPHLSIDTLLGWFGDRARDTHGGHAWDLTLYFLFVHLLELLQFDAVIDKLSLHFNDLILSQEDPLRARHLFGIKPDEVAALDLSDDAVRLAWDLGGYRSAQRVTPDMSVSVIASVDVLERPDNLADILQYHVNPRTQLRICSVRGGSTGERRKSLLGGTTGSSSSSAATNKTASENKLTGANALLSSTASSTSTFSNVGLGSAFDQLSTEPHALPATRCEICGVEAGKTGAYMFSTYLFSEFHKCQLCCMADPD